MDNNRRKFYKNNDCREITIDETLGLLLIFSFIPPGKWYIIAALIIFRIIDNIKPYPIKYIEKNKAIGILMDDIVAGFYTIMIVRVLIELNNYFSII